jgi:hypothetical protein
MLLEQRAVARISVVIAGLDPAIHRLTKMMDARVKRAFTPVFDGLWPAHDAQSERSRFFDLLP